MRSIYQLHMCRGLHAGREPMSRAVLFQVYLLQRSQEGYGNLQMIDVLHDVRGLSAWNNIAQQVWLKEVVHFFCQLSIGNLTSFAVCAGFQHQRRWRIDCLCRGLHGEKFTQAFLCRLFRLCWPLHTTDEYADICCRARTAGIQVLDGSGTGWEGNTCQRQQQQQYTSVLSIRQ